MDNLCPLCKTEPENCVQVLRDCSLVWPIWFNIGSTLPPNFFSSIPVKDWVKKWSFSNFETTFHHSIHWKDVFPILCWSIWTSRNKIAMEGANFVVHDVLKRAKSLAIEFFFSLPHKGDKPPKSTILIGWRLPPHGYVKLNTDDSVLDKPGQARA